MTKRIKFVCPHCGSDNVLRDAYAQWDEVKQEWSLSSTFNNAVCDDCGEDTKDLEEVEIDEVQS